MEKQNSMMVCLYSSFCKGFTATLVDGQGVHFINSFNFMCQGEYVAEKGIDRPGEGRRICADDFFDKDK